MLSGYHELNDRWAVMGDFGWENWSKFGEVDVSVVSSTTTSLTTTTKYDDTYHVGIGTQYRLNPEWLLTAGSPMILRWSRLPIDPLPSRSLRHTSSAWAPIG